LPALALTLIRALPTSPAVFLSRTILLVYLLLRPDYRAEIRVLYRLVCKRDSRWFWVRNAWCVGRNLALMARLDRPSVATVVDSARVCRDNGSNCLLEQELHTTMASFHFGTWELLPGVYAREGLPVRLVTGRQTDGKLAAQLERLRAGSGVSLARSLREVLGATNEPGVSGFMLDNTSRGEQVEVEADGIVVRMPSAAFKLSRRRGNGVVPAFIRLERSRLEVTTYPAGNEREVALSLLEQVRQHPEEWVFWAKAGAFRSAEAA